MPAIRQIAMQIKKLEKEFTGVSYNLCHPLEELFGNVIIEGVFRK